MVIEVCTQSKIRPDIALSQFSLRHRKPLVHGHRKSRQEFPEVQPMKRFLPFHVYSHAMTSLGIIFPRFRKPQGQTSISQGKMMSRRIGKCPSHKFRQAMMMRNDVTVLRSKFSRSQEVIETSKGYKHANFTSDYYTSLGVSNKIISPALCMIIVRFLEPVWSRKPLRV